MSQDPRASDDFLSVQNIAVRRADVRLIVAESGLGLSGGEMIVWKRNVVITQQRRYVSRGTPQANAAAFEHWLDLCPRAVGIRTDGSLKLPHVAPGPSEDPLRILGDALKIVKHELARQVLKTAGFAVLVFLLGVGCAAATIAYRVGHANSTGYFHFAVFSIVMLVAAVMFFFRAAHLFSRRNRIVGVLSSLLTTGEFNPELLVAAVAPSAALVPLAVTGEPAPRSATTPITIALAVLSVPMVCCPYVGIVLAGIALALTFRRKSWVRTLAIIALILNILFTIFFTVMALRNDNHPARRHGLAPLPPLSDMHLS